MDKALKELDFKKQGGLIPVIVQDANTKDILMFAYVNEEALKNTIQTGRAWFWSRSRNKLWMKGEESGNFQQVKKVMVDCDSDALVYLVEPAGPTCHTGNRTCFHNELHE